MGLVMGDQRGTTSLGMEGKRRPSSLSRDRCNSHASQRLTGDHRGSRTNMKPEVGECWIQDSCQGDRVVQYCNNSHGSSRATTPSQIQRSATLQGAKEGQELYDSMKRAMEKKLRENRHSCQDQTTSTNYWKPVCRKDPETETKRNDVHENQKRPRDTDLVRDDEVPGEPGGSKSRLQGRALRLLCVPRDLPGLPSHELQGQD